MNTVPSTAALERQGYVEEETHFIIRVGITVRVISLHNYLGY